LTSAQQYPNNGWRDDGYYQNGEAITAMKMTEIISLMIIITIILRIIIQVIITKVIITITETALLI
jgi:hypothetical protein